MHSTHPPPTDNLDIACPPPAQSPSSARSVTYTHCGRPRNRSSTQPDTKEKAKHTRAHTHTTKRSTTAVTRDKARLASVCHPVARFVLKLKRGLSITGLHGATWCL